MSDVNPVPSHENDGVTISMPHCDVCPETWAWPAKNLITGCCPRCGKLDDRAWRFAAARRVIQCREREARDA